MDEEQLLDYEEEQDETHEQQPKNDVATNGEAANKKIKVFSYLHSSCKTIDKN
jgi:hypothetical protein